MRGRGRIVVVAGFVVGWILIVGLWLLGRHLATRAETAKSTQVRGPVVGRVWPKLSYKADDGRPFAVADGSHWTALVFASAKGRDADVGGLEQLARLLPSSYLVVVPPAQTRAAPSTKGATLLASGRATKLRDAAARVRTQPFMGDGEYWMIDPHGVVAAYGRGELDLADVAWPTIAEAEKAAAESFQPTPLAQLSPDGANHRWRQRKLAVWRSWLGEAQKAYGRHDPKWDALVPPFLENSARRAAASPDCPPNQVLVAQATQLLDLGCDDPLVLHQAAQALRDAGVEQRVTELCVKAAAGVPSSGYPARVVFFLPFAVPVEAEPKPGTPEFRAMVQRVADACSGTFADGERQVVADQLVRYGIVDDCRGTQNLREPNPLYALLQRPDADLWLRLVIHGSQTAALALGSSTFLHSSLRHDDRELNAQMEQSEVARKELSLACRLFPDHAAAAAPLATVAAADRDASACRRWSERAFAADANDAAALRSLPQALASFYDADTAAMLQFGREAADRSLADTLASFAGFEALVAADSAAQRSAMPPGQPSRSSAALGAGPMWQQGGAADAVLAGLDTTIAAAKEPAEAARLRSVKLGVLVMAKRDDAAAALRSELGDAVDVSYVLERLPMLEGPLLRWMLNRELGTDAWQAVATALHGQATDEQVASLEKWRDAASSSWARRWCELQLVSATALQARAAAARASAAGVSDVPATILTLEEPFAAFSAKLPTDGTRPSVKDGVARFDGKMGSLLRYAKPLPEQFQVSADVLPTADATCWGRLCLEHTPGHMAVELMVYGSGRVHTPNGGSAQVTSGSWHNVAIRVLAGRISYLVDGRAVAGPSGDFDTAAEPGPYYWQVDGVGNVGRGYYISMRNLAVRDLGGK